jgi:hypothetical protein
LVEFISYFFEEITMKKSLLVLALGLGVFGFSANAAPALPPLISTDNERSKLISPQQIKNVVGGWEEITKKPLRGTKKEIAEMKAEINSAHEALLKVSFLKGKPQYWCQADFTFKGARRVYIVNYQELATGNWRRQTFGRIFGGLDATASVAECAPLLAEQIQFR